MSLVELASGAWAWLVEAATTRDLDSVLAAVLFVHLWIGLATGRFSRARTTTWVLAIIGSLTVGALSLTGVLLGRANAIAEAAGWGLLLADMGVAYFGAWRLRGVGDVLWRVAAVVALVVVADAIAIRATESPASDVLLTPRRIVPPWFDMPIYAVLRSVPDKLAGVALALVVALVPALWPLVGRARRAIAFWPAWLAVAAVWACLGAIGERSPEEPTATAARILTALWLGFFLLGPFLLRRLKPGGRGGTSG